MERAEQGATLSYETTKISVAGLKDSAEIVFWKSDVVLGI